MHDFCMYQALTMFFLSLFLLFKIHKDKANGRDMQELPTLDQTFITTNQVQRDSADGVKGHAFVMQFIQTEEEGE